VKKNRRQSFIRHFLFFIVFSSLAGCAVDSSELDSGYFIDAPVKGLMFQSGAIVGRTDSDGRFYYEGNQPLTFSIDGVVIGESLPGEYLFPFDLFTSTLFVSDTRVTNVSRFLQSLDEDGNADNGIVIGERTRSEVVALFGTTNSIDFSTSSFEAITSTTIVKTNGLQSEESAKTHLLSSLADYNRLEVDLINLGDGFTAGVQSAEIGFQNFSTSSINLHQYTQASSYAALMAGEMRNALGGRLNWTNPLLKINEDRSKELITSTYHYNVAVPGATAQSLTTEASQSFASFSAETEHTMLNELLVPLFKNLSGTTCPPTGTQLDAARCLANQSGHKQKLKIFTLWIGMNDVLGAVTAKGGSELTLGLVGSNLSGLPSVENNIFTIMSSLTSVPDSYLFIATLPDVTRTGALFYKEDVDFLAQFNSPDVTALTNYSSAVSGDIVALGFSGFTSIAGYLNITSNNATLDSAINGLSDNLTLSWDEAELIKTRVYEINSSINSYADPVAYPNVFVVDMHHLFEETIAQTEVTTGTFLDRGYGGGFFSMDGIYPSNTGYALIAKEFLGRIRSPYTITDENNAAFALYTAFVNTKGINTDNGIGIKVNTGNINLNGIWSRDPYRDNDGDGFPDGPGNIVFLNGTSIPSGDPFLNLLKDCDDNNINTLPETISGISCN